MGTTCETIASNKTRATMNFANIANKAKKEEVPITNVQVEGLVVAKIIKHCKECLPNFVTGQLLGLDIGATLEITYSFPFPTKSEDAGAEEDEDATYQLE